MQTLTPYLWFDNNAEEAIDLYKSIFDSVEVQNLSRYGEGMPMPAGTLMTASLEINGQSFIFLNGGPQFKFSEAVSFLVNCETQEEVDRLWSKLTADGGEEGRCGWLKDRFGLSWQIIPRQLSVLMGDPDPVKAQRVAMAMFQMQKIDIAALQRAFDGNTL